MQRIRVFLRHFRQRQGIITGSTATVPQDLAKRSAIDMEVKNTRKATFALSWFWFPEAQFGCANGVVATKVGYTGGTKSFPTYRSLWV